MTTPAKPAMRPARPEFSSGPCAKRPGWKVENLQGALVGRSHRSKPGKARLKEAIDQPRAVLQVPAETIGAIAEFIALRVIEEPFDTPVSTRLVAEYVSDIKAMYPWWTPDVAPRMTGRDVEPPNGRWLVAYRDGRAVGCAGLKPIDDEKAERNFVNPAVKAL